MTTRAMSESALNSPAIAVRVPLRISQTADTLTQAAMSLNALGAKTIGSMMSLNESYYWSKCSEAGAT